jgi:hypothetical protein
MSKEVRRPGWDAKAIKEVVQQHYNGRLADLFEEHGWPERGAAMMPAQGRRIASIYGTIDAFVASHRRGREGNFVLNPAAALRARPPQVVLTAYWGFDPENWPCLTFTDESRLQYFLNETRPGFFCVIYGNNTSYVSAEMRGRVIGIYQLSHQTGDTEDFLSPSGLKRKRDIQANENSWKYAFRAIRAWQVAPDSAPPVADFANESYSPDHGMVISRYGTMLSGAEARKIFDLDLIPRPLFGTEFASDGVLEKGKNALKPSRPGPVSQTSFFSREAEGPKHLYVLQLEGNSRHFLGHDCGNQRIVKVGFSKSPATRRDDHNRALPECAFAWRVLKSTLSEGVGPYATSHHAKAGEQEMIRRLLASGKSLGGEFFLADDDAIEAAWLAGKRVAGKWKA